jgi:hypothetical protein
MARAALVGILLAAVSVSAAAQTTTYTYAGDPYTAASPPYSLGGSVTGTFTTASPLPAFLPLTDIRPSLAGLSFSDGVATRTLATSFVCRFEVATDGAGNITQWALQLRESPYTPLAAQHTIDSSGEPGPLGGLDLAGTGPAAADPCGLIVLTTSGGSSTPGAWTDDFAQPTAPTTYTYSGDPYTSADPPYTVGGNLDGTLTTANPLPPFLPLTDIRPAIASLAFDDGVQVRTLANSMVCSFQVATDGAGNITRWRVTLREFPFTTGSAQGSIDSSGDPGEIEGTDLAGSGLAGPGPCSPFVLTTAASSPTQGTWTDDNPLATQPTTYTYTGDPYTSATGSYSLGDRLTGTLTTANPLPPFLPLTDVTGALAALSFDDGVAVRTLADSFLCQVQVATDGAGNITRWRITLRESPYSPASPQHSIDSSGEPTFPEGADQVGTGPANASPCGLVLFDEAASTGTQGTWTDSHATPTQPTGYHYTGDPFTTASPPYALGGRVTGTIVTAGPLPASMPLTDVTAALESLSFTDGVQTRTLASSFLCTFRVATDGAGDITEWQVTLRQSPFSTGDPQQAIDSSGSPGIQEGADHAGTGPAGPSPCSPMVLAPFAATGSQGTWTRDALISEIPALDGAGLTALVGLLAAAALAFLRR